MGGTQGQSVQLWEVHQKGRVYHYWEVHHKVRVYNYGRYTTRSECTTMEGTPQGQSVQLWEVHQTVRVYHYGRYTTRLVSLWDIHYNVVWLVCVFNGKSGDVHCQHSWSTFFFFCLATLSLSLCPSDITFFF